VLPRVLERAAALGLSTTTLRAAVSPRGAEIAR